MKNNIKTAKQLIKIAKSLIAFQRVGDVFYRIMDKEANEISVNFSIQTKDRDEFMIWMDNMLSVPTEVKELAKEYGFEDMPHTMDVNNGINGTFFSICLKGNAECDLDGLIEKLKETYECNEVK